MCLLLTRLIESLVGVDAQQCFQKDCRTVGALLGRGPLLGAVAATFPAGNEDHCYRRHLRDEGRIVPCPACHRQRRQSQIRCGHTHMIAQALVTVVGNESDN